MPTVGTLTVDLVANTASFQSDLGKAAQSAEEFGKSASAAGESVSYSMGEARGGIALMSEELGVHIPRHLQTLIAEIPGVGLAFETMLPVVGVIAAIAIVEKLIEKHKEAAAEITEAWEAVTQAMRKNNEETKVKLLELAIQFDGLTHNHAQALVDELKKIDAMTLQHLEQAFEGVAKQADKVFLTMQKGETSFWFGGNWNSAAKQVKSDLDAFNAKLETLVATGSKADVAAAVTQHLADVTAALNKEQALQGKETGHKDRVAALQQELGLAQNLSQVYANTERVENAEKKNVVTKSSNEDAEKAKKDAEIIRKAFESADKTLIEGWEKVTRAANAGFEKQLEWAARADRETEESSKRQQALLDTKLSAGLKAAEEQFKAEEENAKHSVAMHKETALEAAQQDILASHEATQTELQLLNRRLEALDKFAADYEKKKQELQDHIAQIERQGAARVKQIQDQSDAERIGALTQAENRMGAIMASTAAKSIVTGQNMEQSFARVGQQMAEAALTNLLQVETIQGRKKLSDAKTAAADAYAWAGNPVLGSVAATAAFASVMAFETGGEVPGSGAYPAIVHGGETVVTKALTEQVKNNTGGGGHTVNVHTQIHAVDAENFGKLLNKHANVVSAHITGQLRKMHKG